MDQIKKCNKNSAQKKSERLTKLVDTLDAMSPMVQIDYRDPTSLEKFSLVTNVRLRNGQLQVREPNQSAALIDQDEIRK